MAMKGFYGQNTDIDAAAEPLASSQVVKSGVVIKALAANTGIVYVGFDADVTASNGFPLAAGAQQSFDVALFTDADPTAASTGNLANIYVIGSAANQGVAYFGV